MKIWRSFAGIVMAAALSCPVMTIAAQTPAQDAKPNAAGNSDTSGTVLPLDQLITKTVHEAWIASGRNEDKFFAMVQELATLSAQNRGIALPDSQEAGVKFGDWIKKQSRKDPDQLLYAVVDRAVRYVGKTQASAASPAK